MSIFDDLRERIDMTETSLKAQMSKVSAEVATLASMIDGNGGNNPPPPPDTTNPLTILPIMKNWTLVRPTGKAGDPDNDYIDEPTDNTISGICFVRNSGVVLHCNANGFTTEHSNYPRSEFREMLNRNWDEKEWPSSGTHRMMCDGSIDVSHLVTRKRIVFQQVHGPDDDVCQIIYDAGQGLGLSHNDGDDWEVIDENYINNTRIKSILAVVNNRIQVVYNGAMKVDIPKSGKGWYFQTGCYVQTGGRSTHKEPAGAYGESTLYDVQVTHS
jgi:hypothetical protein